MSFKPIFFSTLSNIPSLVKCTLEKLFRTQKNIKDPVDIGSSTVRNMVLNML